MSRTHQENTTTFAEVFTTNGISYQQNRSFSSSTSNNDNRLMLYFQGVKLYIPDNVKQETLSATLQAIKQL